jgi:hypothetical protein
VRRGGGLRCLSSYGGVQLYIRVCGMRKDGSDSRTQLVAEWILARTKPLHKRTALYPNNDLGPLSNTQQSLGIVSFELPVRCQNSPPPAPSPEPSDYIRIPAVSEAFEHRIDLRTNYSPSLSHSDASLYTQTTPLADFQTLSIWSPVMVLLASLPEYQRHKPPSFALPDYHHYDVYDSHKHPQHNSGI